MPNPSTVEADDSTPEENVAWEDHLAELDSVDYIVSESKAGYKTTEFWITVITSLAVVFNGLPAPESKEGYIVAAIAGVYAIARGLAKSGAPDTEQAEGPV